MGSSYPPQIDFPLSSNAILILSTREVRMIILLIVVYAVFVASTTNLIDNHFGRKYVMLWHFINLIGVLALEVIC